MTNLALIGKGAWGKNYINTIIDLRDCSLQRSNIKTRDYKSLLREGKIDGVIIATPASTHFEIAKEFLEKGFNILVEKPLTTNYKDARVLADIVNKNNNIAMVGHIFIYNPAFLELKNQIKKIGKIKSITSEGMGNGPIRSDASALWDWGPHDVSMITFLLGLPVYVSALETGPNPGDSYTLKLSFSEGLVTSSKISRVSFVKKRSMAIIGKDGEIVFDDLADFKLKVRIYSQKKDYYPEISKITPLENELMEFIFCIKNKIKPKTDFTKSIIVQKILEACEESASLGGEKIKIN